MSPRKPKAIVLDGLSAQDQVATVQRGLAEQASAVVALLDPPPIPVAEYLEAAMEPVGAGVPDSLPDDDLGDATDAITAMLGAEAFPVFTPPAPDDVPCPHCAGSGRVPADSIAPALPAWDELPPHALDSAPLNSKIVVVLLDGKSHAVLAGPDGAKELPKGDPAHRLPEGARIRKVAEREFLAEQMSPAEDHAPITRESTQRAIADFIPHFHPHGLS